MITISQIKAARSLLDWSQANLAIAAAISLPTLSNIERGAAVPRVKTLASIEKSLVNAGIEFIDGPGVRFQSEILKINMFEGKDAITRLFDDIYEHMRKDGGDLLVGGVSEKQFIKVAAETVDGLSAQSQPP